MVADVVVLGVEVLLGLDAGGHVAGAAGVGEAGGGRVGGVLGQGAGGVPAGVGGKRHGGFFFVFFLGWDGVVWFGLVKLRVVVVFVWS